MSDKDIKAKLERVHLSKMSKCETLSLLKKGLVMERWNFQSSSWMALNQLSDAE